MFYKCSSLLSLSGISKWNTSIITDMSYMFDTREICSKDNSFFGIHIGVCTPQFSYFTINSKLASLPDISKWNTSNVSNMSCMFRDCYLLLSLPDISKWNTSNVVDMSGIFSGCKSLLTLPDISKWDTSCVSNMSNMFGGFQSGLFLSGSCSSLTSMPDIS